ncbi:leucine-rich repeat serine/threonine-protein kinase 2-like [Protopterus annectens]|uniref:leucine-rich repeat serine/threonine-protein kinase 2-like n=1 Tax=Protopterus annectens TaxID=7888 RepID=UPI001CFA5A50|nr:leucine-rich repeat serine/threonine-protein kinase 2-like [Protopterus annectens]
MDNWEELEENLKKLIVKLKHVEERKQVETVIQTLDDLLQFMYIDSAFTLFEDKVIHIPVLVVLESYMDFAGVQQMGWSVLCRLMEVCPSTLDKLAVSSGVAKDWDFLGIHQQILKMLCMHNGNEMIITLGLKTLTLLLKSDAIALLVLDDETDVFQIVVDALKSFTNEEVQKYGCETLRILLEKVSDAQLVEFVESKDHAVILNALNQFQHSEDIVLNALGAVLPLASPLSNVEVLMSGSARCYKLVIDAMNKFPNNEKLQEISCCLFQKFTSGNTRSKVGTDLFHYNFVYFINEPREGSIIDTCADKTTSD